ncbi:MAG: 50S ribosomal protein L19 [Patescibacteria group bacterium]|nr:50S ribosomal protein L19 [Patescibacteria group bacterium]
MIEKKSFTISPVDIGKRSSLDLTAGNTVKVWQKIKEKGKTRLQAFEGLLIARKHGVEPGATFTVRKITSNVGVEKTFPLYSPNIDKIEILRRAKVRRAKLYYIREKVAKEVRRAMRNLQTVKAAAPIEAETETTETPEAPVEAEVVENKEEATVATAEKN